MKRLGVTLALALLFAATAQAVTDFGNAPSGAHYAKGAAEPVCTISGTTVSCTGTQIQGVGNTNARAVLDVSTTISGVCHDPGNDKIVEPHSKTTTGESAADLTPSRNGRLDVPPLSAAGATSTTFTCPNKNWRPEITSVVTSFTYTLTFAGFGAPVISISG